MTTKEIKDTLLKLKKGFHYCNVVSFYSYSKVQVYVDDECVEEQEWSNDELRKGVIEHGSIWEWMRQIAITNLQNNLEND